MGISGCVNGWIAMGFVGEWMHGCGCVAGGCVSECMGVGRCGRRLRE